MRFTHEGCAIVRRQRHVNVLNQCGQFIQVGVNDLRQRARGTIRILLAQFDERWGIKRHIDRLFYQ